MKRPKILHKIGLVTALLTAFALMGAGTAQATTTPYPDQTLTSSGWVEDSGHFNDVWDLTQGDMTLAFRYDANGMVDSTASVEAHAWAELGVRTAAPGATDFSPYWTYYVPVTKTVALMSGSNAKSAVQVGTVQITRDGTNVNVEYVITAQGWCLAETHLAIAGSLDGIPQRNGNPPPGQFPYSTVHNPCVTSFAYSVPDTWLGLSIVVAAHAQMQSTSPSGKVSNPTAWAAGDPFPGKNWATYVAEVLPPETAQGQGVWLATDFPWTVGALDPSPGAQALNDKLILQRRGGQAEGAYNLPSTPPAPGNNYRIWWDRDTVDPWQSTDTANTGGIYNVVITLHATSATTGTAYMTINGKAQGFETNGDWLGYEGIPYGMTFGGDMTKLRVFYGLVGYGATHTATFSNITVTQ